MIRATAIGIALAIATLLALALLLDSQTRTHVPPALQAYACTGVPPRDELPAARFSRMGGRTTKYVNIRYEGGALTTDNVEQGRNLRLYETFIADLGRTATGNQLRANARVFLWGHWQNKKPAYLVLTMHSVDSTATSHIFVEEDDFHHWRVYERVVRKKEIDDTPTDYSVGWVHPQDWDMPGLPLAHGEVPNPLIDKLELRDICGESDGSL